MKTMPGYAVKFCSFIALLAISGAVTADQVLYVQSAKAKLMVSPSFNSQRLQVLEKGAPVTLVKEQGRWLLVNHQNSSGWIPKLLLADHPPLDKVSILKGKQKQLEKSARRRASTNNTAAATRGLRSDNRARISDQEKPDYAQLEKMEAVDIPQKQVLEFQRKAAPSH